MKRILCRVPCRILTRWLPSQPLFYGRYEFTGRYFYRLIFNEIVIFLKFSIIFLKLLTKYYCRALVFLSLFLPPSSSYFIFKLRQVQVTLWFVIWREMCMRILREKRKTSTILATMIRTILATTISKEFTSGFSSGDRSHMT